MEKLLRELRRMGIKHEQVLAATTEVDRKDFVPEDMRHLAYADRALPIGFGQTISQPYTVARMCELLVESGNPPAGRAGLRVESSKVLEIGTGSGWQTAILAKLFENVYSIELIPELAREARVKIKKLKLRNVVLRTGDGKEGWVEHAPYDGIICGADAVEIPQAWREQLAAGGRIVCPVRGEMTRITKILYTKHFRTEKFGRYSFVPLV